MGIGGTERTTGPYSTTKRKKISSMTMVLKTGNHDDGGEIAEILFPIQTGSY
jgi:hypothetical protein